MKILLATLGGLALKFLAMVAIIVLYALLFWVLVPMVFPAWHFDFGAALGVTGVLVLVKGLFK